MRNWYCIYTKRGQEDNVTIKLSELPHIEMLNPKIQRKKFVRSRLTQVVEELFPAYIFGHLDLAEYGHLVQYTRGVRRFVGDRSGKAYEVDPHIIEFIKGRLQNGFVVLEKESLKPGDLVRVEDGLFAGYSGEVLLEMKPDERVMVLLTSLESRLKVELPRCCVSRVQAAGASRFL